MPLSQRPAGRWYFTGLVLVTIHVCLFLWLPFPVLTEPVFHTCTYTIKLELDFSFAARLAKRRGRLCWRWRWRWRRC